jgi:hypothetical protein
MGNYFLNLGYLFILGFISSFPEIRLWDKNKLCSTALS